MKNQNLMKWFIATLFTCTSISTACDKKVCQSQWQGISEFATMDAGVYFDSATYLERKSILERLGKYFEECSCNEKGQFPVTRNGLGKTIESLKTSLMDFEKTENLRIKMQKEAKTRDSVEAQASTERNLKLDSIAFKDATTTGNYFSYTIQFPNGKHILEAKESLAAKQTRDNDEFLAQEKSREQWSKRSEEEAAQREKMMEDPIYFVCKDYVALLQVDKQLQREKRITKVGGVADLKERRSYAEMKVALEDQFEEEKRQYTKETKKKFNPKLCSSFFEIP